MVTYMDCGSLLPLSHKQPAAYESWVLEPIRVQQQAVGRKAAAGCSTPRSFPQQSGSDLMGQINFTFDPHGRCLDLFIDRRSR